MSVQRIFSKLRIKIKDDFCAKTFEAYFIFPKFFFLRERSEFVNTYFWLTVTY